MNLVMVRREFLGWERPLVDVVVEWLWERREEMPGMLVVVPTAQAGRNIRKALAQKGACLAPQVVTPGYLLITEDAAPAAAEVLAWVETLEGVKDWAAYENLFPSAPGTDEPRGWSLPLANSLMDLEASLQGAALTIESAARRLSKSVEADRWEELASLWRLKERQLSSWRMSSRSHLLEQLIEQPLEGRIVLAGVPDLPEASMRRLENTDLICLIGAPEGEVFDEMGRPDPEVWNEREIALPKSVELAADPRQQAMRAVELVAEAKTTSDHMALGSADEEVGEEMVRAFERAGWPLHNPAGGAISAPRGWLALWRAWILKPDAARAIDLLGRRETEGLVGKLRSQRAKRISMLRNKYLVRSREDIERAEAKVIDLEKYYRDEEDEEPRPIATETMERLDKARVAFLNHSFIEAMDRLLGRVDPEAEWVEVREWMNGMKSVIKKVDRDAGFWLDLLVSQLSNGDKEPPEDRVADVHGWLELLHTTGSHVVVGGMNEGRVPAALGNDMWLTDGVREMFGLSTDASRAARDAYILGALMSSRERVDLLLGKSSGDGDTLLPSRLLLATKGEELAKRVKVLFAEVEPPDAGMKWHADWKWQLPVTKLKARLNVTALKDYLACPLRFYLKYGVSMWGAEPERVEWNARDFGNIVHLVLELWGRDSKAKEYSKVDVLEEWLLTQLDAVVSAQFGEEPPLAVRIQVEGAKNRLIWFARKQACLRAEGWQVEDVEQKIEYDIEGVTLVGKVDRIDRHADGRRRVLDYKTYDTIKKVEQDHRTMINASTVLPAHLQDVEAVIGANANGKDARWTNLQVPLYSSFLAPVDELGYFILGSSEANTDISLWGGFRDVDRDSAMACAEWIISQVKAGVFSPAADRTKYDDFELLSMGRRLEEMVEPVNAAG